MNHVGLFEGIGGFSLAGRWAGWETKGWVEINPFCQQVLKYHFPEAQGFSDIKKFSYAVYKSILRNRGIKDRSINIITGGFPCQPYSSAGLRKGTDDPRHLWPHMLETIRQFKPTWVVGENVRGITNWNGGLVFEQVQVDLEAIGYEVQAFVLPACAVDAPHRRDRVWFVAHARDNGSHGLKDRQSMGKRNDGNQAGAKQAFKFEGCSNEGSAITANGSNSGVKNLRPKRQNSVHGLRTTSNPMSAQRERQVGGMEPKFVAGREFAITYTKCEGLEGRDWSRKSVRLESGGEKVAANSDRSIRCQGGMYQIRRIQTERHVSPCGAWAMGNWKDFPTQSPLCGRDDGLSTQSPRITIPENRNNMDRSLVTKLCLDEGRLKVDFKTGEIYSLKQRGKEGQEVKLLGADCNGYVVHGIRYNGFKIQLKAHQIVWIAANGLYDKSVLMIDHINRNKKDNRLENLRLVDAKGNRENATPYNGKLTYEQRDMMTWLHKEDGIPMRELAEDFGISKSRVQQIIAEHSGVYGITFPRHRRESIQAYGNAIVPQVAYQIFKSINDYESMNPPQHQSTPKR